MRQRAAEALVLFAVSVDDRGGHFANDMGKSLRLGHVALVALMHAMSIDILPSPRVGKGKMTWADAHDGSVSIVESLGIERLGTACMLGCPWYSRCTLEQRSREAAQWVDERLYTVLAASHTSTCNNRATLEPGIHVEKKGVINSYYAQCNRNSLQPQMELARTHGILPHGCSCWISSLPACPRNLGCEG